MKLKANTKYVSDRSDLCVEIVKILKEEKYHTKVLLNLFNKRNNIIYEYQEIYELYHNGIKHWKELNNELHQTKVNT